MEDYYSDTQAESLENILKELQREEPMEHNHQKLEIEQVDIDPNNLEKFILDNGAKAVQSTQAIIKLLFEQIKINPDPELITSVAEMLGSNNKALETLNKIYLNKEKFKQSVEMEGVKAQAKMAQLEVKSERPPMTREEVLKIIFEDSDIKNKPVNKELTGIPADS